MEEEEKGSSSPLQEMNKGRSQSHSNVEEWKVGDLSARLCLGSEMLLQNSCAEGLVPITAVIRSEGFGIMRGI